MKVNKRELKLINSEAQTHWVKDKNHILLIDDDPKVSNYIKNSFKKIDSLKLNYFQDEVESIKSFLDEKYDLCIIDISLKRINGFSLSKVIRAMSHYEIPIIYISRDKNYLDLFYEHGMANTYFYAKPLSKEPFIDVTLKMLGQK